MYKEKIKIYLFITAITTATTRKYNLNNLYENAKAIHMRDEERMIQVVSATVHTKEN